MRTQNIFEMEAFIRCNNKRMRQKFTMLPIEEEREKANERRATDKKKKKRKHILNVFFPPNKP